jgi:DHA1 family bicyclomycin/chloramphenicol resistance-like MFS transporter
MATLAWSGVRGVAAVIAPMFFFSLGLGLANPNAVAGAVGPYPTWRVSPPPAWA